MGACDNPRRHPNYKRFNKIDLSILDQDYPSR